MLAASGTEQESMKKQKAEKAKVHPSKKVLFVCDYNTSIGVMVGTVYHLIKHHVDIYRQRLFSTIWVQTWREGGSQTLLVQK